MDKILLKEGGSQIGLKEISVTDTYCRLLKQQNGKLESKQIGQCVMLFPEQKR